jgi:hypothetical protein
MHENQPFHSEIAELKNELLLVKERLSKIELLLGAVPEKKEQERNTTVQPVEEEFEINFSIKEKNKFENSVGEYGMAWIGNIILFFGIVFLSGFLQKTENQLISDLVCFTTLAGIYFCAYYIRDTYAYLARLLTYNGHLMLYYISLRLHFFQENPIVASKLAGLLIILAVSFAVLFIAFNRGRQVLAGIAFLMLLTSGVVSRNIVLAAALPALVAAISVYFYYRFGWLKLAFIFIFLIYIAHLNWLLNNPFLGNQPELVFSPNGGYIFFIATGFIFSLIALIPKRDNVSNDFIIASIIWNGLGFTFLLALIIITYFMKNYVLLMGSVTLFCITYAVILKLKSEINVLPSIYVLYGFIALSVAIFGVFGLPDSYPLFAWQSLLVVSMALWFRSRFMTVMNTLLFFIFMIVYLKAAGSSNIANFSFMLVALISARIINWKKERLNIKTEAVRNFYLAAGFTMTLFAFHHAFPEKFITASWIGAAIMFFGMSILIKNIKYRWIAMATMIASAVKLIFVDMSTINIGYRVLIFLLLAIISLTLSVIYSRYFNKKEKR